jgi:hypothetical protein
MSQAISWIDKELKKRRAALAQPPASPQPLVPSEVENIQKLWDTIKQANEELPPELRLAVESADPSKEPAFGPPVRVWLRAPNGAAMGFADGAIRYVWPKLARRRSNNFWIRWNSERNHFVLARRLGNVEYVYRFDERSIDSMIRRLVLGKRIKANSLRVKRFWLF